MEIVLIIIISVLAVAIVWDVLFLLPTRWLKVERVKWDSKAKKKVIQISDLHIKHLRVPITTLKQLIEDEQPDYVFLTGDFIDKNEKEFPKLERFLTMIQQTGVETYAVLGNHDRYIEEVHKLEEILGKYQVHLLKNEYVEKEDLFIVGIDDFCQGHHDIKRSFQFSNPLIKDILVLTHDPDIVDDLKESYTMLVSGHLHGKQVNVPYLFKVADMGRLAKRGIYKGQHVHSNGTFYISKGIGQSRWNIRFMVRSEVTIHELS
ncbi:metallophosphoesterase [Pontibacillus yanchengensis]|uniref:metallophosphoesterase n=1 Tax=Pontibacillus yanchengensis TaxID=462910 RepID=UPI001368FA65|nr:metallophosphoesterase [Pontibacillus yanchengensis]